MPNVSLVDGHIDEPKRTNYDRIRNMSVEELAEELSFRVICSYCPCKKLCAEHNDIGCVEVFKLWLGSEVDNNGCC